MPTRGSPYPEWTPTLRTHSWLARRRVHTIPREDTSSEHSRPAGPWTKGWYSREPTWRKEDTGPSSPAKFSRGNESGVVVQSHMAGRGSGIVWDGRRPLHNRHPSHFLAMAVFGDWQKHLMSTSACVNTGFIRVVERVWTELCLALCSQ